MHQASLEKFGKDWTKPGNLVSNGAYVLKEWQVNSKVVIEKNPHYWDAKNVQLTQVTYLPVEDGNADVKLYESGENEWVYQLPPGTYEKYKTAVPQGDPQRADAGPALLLATRPRAPLFKDVRVRKALSMVIDRDILAQRITADGQAPAYGADRQGRRRRRRDGLRLGHLAHGQARGRGQEAAGSRPASSPAPSSRSRTTPANTTRRWRSSPLRSGRPSWA